MGKLVFYSDQIAESPGNQRLDHLLLEGLDTENSKIGYIPSTKEERKKYFHTKAQYYRNYGIQDTWFFDLYDEFNLSKIDDLLTCDVIHLSAGNPIEFKKALKHRNIDKVLCDYFHEGGIIAGVSGGAVQLGKTIKLFQLFARAADEDLAGLHLVDFEFLPHYNRWNEDYKRDVQNYVETTGTTVYAAKDGDGIVVEDGRIRMVGDIVVIDRQKR